MDDAERWETDDQRRAAMHEAGHVVVARHLGLEANAAIWRVGDWSPTELAWAGRADVKNVELLAAPERRMIAVAGLVAEVGNETTRGLYPDVAATVMNPKGWSDRDLEMYGSDPFADEPLLCASAESVWTLLFPTKGLLWPELRGLVEDLERDSDQSEPASVG